MTLELEDIKMLEEIRQSYIRQADNIKNWKTMDKNKLANLYLDYEHVEPERSYYFSALMCRYWNNVYKFYKTSKSARLEISDFTVWLAESFFVAFKYRKWRDPTSRLFNDPQAPDKVINRCIYSTRMRYYQYYNMDKRRLNFQTDSIERQIESFGHLANVYNYLAVMDKSEENTVSKEIINYYLSKNGIFTAIILDLICFDDTFTVVKRISKDVVKHDVNDYESQVKNAEFDSDEQEDSMSENFDEYTIEEVAAIDDIETDVQDIKEIRTVYSLDFSVRKLLTAVRGLDLDYSKYFLNTYKVEYSGIISTLDRIKELDKSKQLSRVVKKILESVAKDKNVGKLLCS